MARDAHNATWRALRRIVDVLLANVGTELTADGPAGLNVTAPAAGDYYVMPNERAVRDHLDRNHRTQVYVFPSGTRERMPRTIGPTAKSQPSALEVTVAVRFLEEAGAADFTETWKTLTPKEREFYRCETLLGAIQDVFDSKMRGPTGTGDDIYFLALVIILSVGWLALDRLTGTEYIAGVATLYGLLIAGSGARALAERGKGAAQ